MGKLTEEDRANLVAYLDGELDDASAQELEVRLNLDPQMRTEADSLKRTWELLDYLPKPEPSPSFTHRTLERLAIKESLPLAKSQRKPKRVWLRALGWAAAVLVAVGVGRLGAQWLLPPPAPPLPRDSAEVEDQMVKHLRLLENKRLYENIEDLDFLRALNNGDLFGDESDS